MHIADCAVTDGVAVGKTCVVCGSTEPVTREHVIPQWLRDTARGKEIWNTPVPDRAHQVSRFNFESEELDYVDRGNARSPFEMQVRAVCARCNNGWMSRLETKFQPVLERLTGSTSAITLPEVRTAEAWAIKTAGMFQMNDPGSRTMPDGLLLPLMINRVPRNTFKVFAFRTQDPEMQLSIRHFGAAFAGISRTSEDVAHIAADITTLGIQGIGFYVCYTTQDANQVEAKLPPEAIVSLRTNRRKTPLPVRALPGSEVYEHEDALLTDMFESIGNLVK